MSKRPPGAHSHRPASTRRYNHTTPQTRRVIQLLAGSLASGPSLTCNSLICSHFTQTSTVLLLLLCRSQGFGHLAVCRQEELFCRKRRGKKKGKKRVVTWRCLVINTGGLERQQWLFNCSKCQMSTSFSPQEDK